MQRHPSRLATLVLAAGLAGLCATARPSIAQAATYAELQQQVQEATATYGEALANVAKIQGEIEENQAQIARIEEQLPAQRQRAAESIRTLYKMQQSSNGIVDLLLSSDDFSSFVATLTYLERIQSKNMCELQALADLNAQLQEAKDTLNARQAKAVEEADRAYEAQQEAVAMRNQIFYQAVAQSEAELPQAQAIIAQVSQEAKEGKTFTTASGNQAAITVPDAPVTPANTSATTTTAPSEQAASAPAQQTSTPTTTTPTAAASTSDRDAYVSSWGARINSYLEGSQLAGYGQTFAEAAYDYGVDPRWSPAIATIESGKGQYCFKDHNAWGWGSASWSDWDSAIRDQVAGLANNYGYTISVDAANTYCPPTANEWYTAVSGEMEGI